MEEELPPGFRFHTTDEELVSYCLTNKVTDSTFVAKAITVVDLNRCEPWDLPDKANMGEGVWYFFGLKDRKYPTGLRTNRATEAGYWKTTGKDKQILASAAGKILQLVGVKKTLVLYKGRAPKGEKTNWVMHEYRLSSKLHTSNLPKVYTKALTESYRLLMISFNVLCIHQSHRTVIRKSGSLVVIYPCPKHDFDHFIPLFDLGYAVNCSLDFARELGRVQADGCENANYVNLA